MEHYDVTELKQPLSEPFYGSRIFGSHSDPSSLLLVIIIASQNLFGGQLSQRV